jgi:hypothetical protein
MPVSKGVHPLSRGRCRNDFDGKLVNRKAIECRPSVVCGRLFSVHPHASTHTLLFEGAPIKAPSARIVHPQQDVAGTQRRDAPRTVRNTPRFAYVLTCGNPAATNKGMHMAKKSKKQANASELALKVGRAKLGTVMMQCPPPGPVKELSAFPCGYHED